MKKIYIAGAYSADNIIDILDNIRKGIRMASILLRAGYAPFCPFVDFLYLLQLREGESLSVKIMQDYSMAWLEKCDAMILLDNYDSSLGTLKEINRADELDIPIFYNLETLISEVK
jgi:hypothetical protein